MKGNYQKLSKKRYALGTLLNNILLVFLYAYFTFVMFRYKALYGEQDESD